MKAKQYQKQIIKKAQEIIKGGFVIKVELPLKALPQFQKEYKSYTGEFISQLDFDKKYNGKYVGDIYIQNNKFGIEYRLYFNATPEQIQNTKFQIHSTKGAYQWCIDNGNFIKGLLSKGAHLGINDGELTI